MSKRGKKRRPPMSAAWPSLQDCCVGGRGCSGHPPLSAASAFCECSALQHQHRRARFGRCSTGGCSADGSLPRRRQGRCTDRLPRLQRMRPRAGAGRARRGAGSAQDAAGCAPQGAARYTCNTRTAGRQVASVWSPAVSCSIHTALPCMSTGCFSDVGCMLGCRRSLHRSTLRRRRGQRGPVIR